MFSAVRYPHPFPFVLPVPPPVPLPENAADICSHADVSGNDVPDRICLCRSVGLFLQKKVHIVRYHGLSHPLLQENAWKPPAGNCFARFPVSGALSWQPPASQSDPKKHPNWNLLRMNCRRRQRIKSSPMQDGRRNGLHKKQSRRKIVCRPGRNCAWRRFPTRRPEKPKNT